MPLPPQLVPKMCQSGTKEVLKSITKKNQKKKRNKMSSSRNMATYQSLKQLYNDGVSPLRSHYRARDTSIETAVLSGSFTQIRYAIKCSKDKVHCAKVLDEAGINVVVNFPNLTGHYLQYKGELTYEKAVALYLGKAGLGGKAMVTQTRRSSRNAYGIYHLLKETHRAEGEEAVNALQAKLVEDGIPERDILYYNLPQEVKDVLFQPDQEEAHNEVVAFYKAKHPKIDFIIYDFIRNSPDAIGATKKLLEAGIPKRLIGSTALVSVVAGKMSVQELIVLYDFDSPHFCEIMEHMLHNPTTFGHKSASSLAEKMVYYGIDKTTILTGVVSK